MEELKKETPAGGMTPESDKTEELLADLDAGLLLQKLGRALRDAALGAVTHGGTGKVTLDLELKRVGESLQVMCKHKVTSSVPTRRGKIIEDNTTGTPLYVGANGRVSLFPLADQRKLFDNKD